MSISPQTLRLISGLRLQVGAQVDSVTRDIISSWVRAWDEQQVEVLAAVDDLLTVAPGEWPSQWQINRSTRAKAAIEHTQDRLTKLAHEAGVQITDSVGEIVDFTARAEPWIIASQYPPGYDTATLAASFDRVSTEALDAIVARSTQQITSLAHPLAPEATAAMKSELIRGVSVGDNPRVTARNMVSRLENRFNGGLTRAMVIARTELIDASRAASMAQHAANTDVLAGWIWLAQLDSRTCPSCFSQSGNLHPLTEPGPMDHQQGRCARVPQTKSWKDLGFDHIEEPPSLIPDSRQVFDSMSPADRLAVMGKDRLAGLEDGSISWSDLSTRRSVDGWRDSFVPATLQELSHPTPKVYSTGKAFADTLTPTSLSEAVAETVDAYRVGAYLPINNSLRSGTIQRSLSGDTAQMIANLDQAMGSAATESDMMVWRGIDRIPDDLEVGSALVDDGFMSTSLLSSEARVFAKKGITLAIRVPQGSRALVIGEGEAEVILDRGYGMRILSVAKSESRTVVNVMLEEPS